MQPSKLLLPGLALVLIAIGFSAWAAPDPLTPPLVPIADAYVWQDQPATPYGTTDPENLETQGRRRVAFPCETNKQALLKFNVSGLA
ncbi:MAG: hypothetical protein C4310_10005, partial [Chloroflexota bacterium]